MEIIAVLNIILKGYQSMCIYVCMYVCMYDVFPKGMCVWYVCIMHACVCACVHACMCVYVGMHVCSVCMMPSVNMCMYVIHTYVYT